MVVMITGGSGSGKSELAENIAAALSRGRLIYIAAMIPRGDEGRKRVERHRKMRADKGFETVERYTALSKCEFDTGSTVLLECMSNLLANEMYEENGSGDSCVYEIINGIDAMINNSSNAVIVTNDVFSDGEIYDDETMKYIKYLGELNRYISSIADEVYESVYSIPVELKGDGLCLNLLQ